MRVFVTQRSSTRLREYTVVVMESESGFDSVLLAHLMERPVKYSQFLYGVKHPIPGDFVDVSPRVTRDDDGRIKRLELSV
jgi:hypothetical protein